MVIGEMSRFKLLYFTVLLLFIVNLSKAQSISGKYIAKEGCVNINDSVFEFNAYWGCCFINKRYIHGNYNLIDSLIFVDAKSKPEIESFYKIIKNLLDTNSLEIKIIDNNSKESISYANVVLKDKLKNVEIISYSTNTEGYVKINNLMKCRLKNYCISLNYFGYSSILIPLDDIIGKSIEINLRDIIVVKDEIVKFKIKKNKENQLVISGPYFKKAKPYKPRIVCSSFRSTFGNYMYFYYDKFKPSRWFKKRIDLHQPIIIEFVKTN